MSAHRGGSARPARDLERGALRAAKAVVFFDMLLVGIMRTVLPFHADALDSRAKLSAPAAATRFGALEACYGIGQALGAVTLGSLSDRRGRVLVLLLSFSGSALGYAFAAVAVVWRVPLLLYASRLPVGLAKQTGSTSKAIVADSTTLARRSEEHACLFGAMACGYAIGPLLGGALLDASEMYLDAAWLPAALCAMSYIVMLACTALYMPETHRPSTKAPPRAVRSGGAPSIVSTWRSPAVVVPVVRCILCEVTTLAGITAVPVYARALNWSATRVGLFNSLWGLGSGLFSLGPLGRSLKAGRVSDRGVGVLGSVAVGCGATVLALAPAAGLTSPLDCLLWGNLVTAAFGIACLRTTPAAIVSKAAPSEARGEALGLLDAAGSVSRILVPLISTACAGWLGSSGPFALQAVTAWCSAALLSTMRLPEPDPRIKGD